MQVELALRWDGGWLSMDEALSRAPELVGEFEHADALDGAWTVRADDATWRWEDGLVSLVSAVCLEALPPLLTRGHAVVGRSVEYGYLRLDAEGDWVRLGGDELPDGRVPTRPFVEGQLGAAGRLISLLGALGLDGFALRALKEDRRAAIAAWSGWTPTDDRQAWGPIPAATPRRDADGAVALVRSPAPAIACGLHRVLLPGPGWEARLRDALPELDARGHVVLPFADRYGYLRLDAEGAAVRISGDGLGDLRVPRAGFVAAVSA